MIFATVGGQERPFRIEIGKLQEKVGSNSAAKKFRFFLKEIIQDGNIPDYEMIVADKIVEFWRKGLKALPKPKGMIALKPETHDKAQGIAAEKGFSLAQLRPIGTSG